LGRGGRRGSAMASFDRLSIVTVALSVGLTIQPQFAIERLVSDTQINRELGHFGPKFPGVPLE